MDLDALDNYLMSDHVPDDSMGLSDLDGFLTGIVVGPEPILPNEWLPVVCGGEEPEFKTEDEMGMTRPACTMVLVPERSGLMIRLAATMCARS
jgi:yecA family protein